MAAVGSLTSTNIQLRANRDSKNNTTQAVGRFVPKTIARSTSAQAPDLTYSEDTTIRDDQQVLEQSLEAISNTVNITGRARHDLLTTPMEAILGGQFRERTPTLANSAAVNSGVLTLPDTAFENFSDDPPGWGSVFSFTQGGNEVVVPVANVVRGTGTRTFTLGNAYSDDAPLGDKGSPVPDGTITNLKYTQLTNGIEDLWHDVEEYTRLDSNNTSGKIKNFTVEGVKFNSLAFTFARGNIDYALDGRGIRSKLEDLTIGQGSPRVTPTTKSRLAGVLATTDGEPAMIGSTNSQGVYINGVRNQIIGALTVTLTRQVDPLDSINCPFSEDLIQGNFGIEGTLTTYMSENEVLFASSLNNSRVSLVIPIRDLDGNYLSFGIPTAKMTVPAQPVSGAGVREVTMSFVGGLVPSRSSSMVTISTHTAS